MQDDMYMTFKERGSYKAVRNKWSRNDCQLILHGNFVMAKGDYNRISRLFEQFANASF